MTTPISTHEALEYINSLIVDISHVGTQTDLPPIYSLDYIINELKIFHLKLDGDVLVKREKWETEEYIRGRIKSLESDLRDLNPIYGREIDDISLDTFTLVEDETIAKKKREQLKEAEYKLENETWDPSWESQEGMIKWINQLKKELKELVEKKRDAEGTWKRKNPPILTHLEDPQIADNPILVIDSDTENALKYHFNWIYNWLTKNKDTFETEMNYVAWYGESKEKISKIINDLKKQLKWEIKAIKEIEGEVDYVEGVKKLLRKRNNELWGRLDEISKIDPSHSISIVTTEKIILNLININRIIWESQGIKEHLAKNMGNLETRMFNLLNKRRDWKVGDIKRIMRELKPQFDVLTLPNTYKFTDSSWRGDIVDLLNSIEETKRTVEKTVKIITEE